MRSVFFTGLALLLLAIQLLAAVNARTVIFALPYDNRDVMQDYHVQLLQKALSYSTTPYILQPAKETMAQSRVLREISLQTGIVDVFWSMTSVEREKMLKPIRVPLSRGLLGWRLLLVNEDVAFLSTQRNKQNTLFVQGHDWPDSQILKANGYKVLTANDYHSLFTMVEKGRVNALPRSVIEIDDEHKNIAKKLFIAPDLMLYYPTAEYFFVSNNDTKLAAAIEHGLAEMYKDGSFNALFEQQYGAILKQLAQQKRKVLKLHNPLLPTATPLDKPEYWQPLPSNFEQVNW
ncbi:MAG: transporter substrate-binding domain-containing protein [Gammaproteobacteria bacterium]|nr:transporter substrate-binding domain-containing protein [Gammaproteobacteria bacterium]